VIFKFMLLDILKTIDIIDGMASYSIGVYKN
jgi:hypothetical protein